MGIQLSKASLTLAWFIALTAAISAPSIATPALIKPQSSSLDGIVIDQVSAAIANAEVVVAPSSNTQKTLTDLSGHFHFASLPKEILTLTITASGFAGVTRKINPATE